MVAHTSTAADGRFRLEGLPLDHYLLRASVLGHVPLSRPDVVLPDQAPDFDLGTQALTVIPADVAGVTTIRAWARD